MYRCACSCKEPVEDAGDCLRSFYLCRECNQLWTLEFPHPHADEGERWHRCDHLVLKDEDANETLCAA